jgi:hypothetical protein
MSAHVIALPRAQGHLSAVVGDLRGELEEQQQKLGVARARPPAPQQHNKRTQSESGAVHARAVDEAEDIASPAASRDAAVGTATQPGVELQQAAAAAGVDADALGCQACATPTKPHLEPEDPQACGAPAAPGQDASQDGCSPLSSEGTCPSTAASELTLAQGSAEASPLSPSLADPRLHSEGQAPGQHQLHGPAQRTALATDAGMASGTCDSAAAEMDADGASDQPQTAVSVAAGAGGFKQHAEAAVALTKCPPVLPMAERPAALYTWCVRVCLCCFALFPCTEQRRPPSAPPHHWHASPLVLPVCTAAGYVCVPGDVHNRVVWPAWVNSTAEGAFAACMPHRPAHVRHAP